MPLAFPGLPQTVLDLLDCRFYEHAGQDVQEDNSSYGVECAGRTSAAISENLLTVGGVIREDMAIHQ
jgi:hypothetical protein